MKLSVVIPVYNEAKTIQALLAAVNAVDLPGLEKEVVIVDDCSTDGTRDVLEKFVGQQYKIFHQEVNQGKGAALRRGFKEATGDFVVIQDADLEYDPEEYPILLGPLRDGRADVVFGSRFVGDRPHRVLFFWHYVGNKVLTIFSNMLTGLNLTDMETCYKAFTRGALQAILPELQSNRFNIEPEITARVAKKKLRIYEVGVSYSGRTYADGKKIGWKDGFSALWSIVKYNLFA
ncbi:MAG: glycosyltransferase family 2 protein [Candidatus Magasanikbacteria bacterium]|nr:glycosyltransferase family 2 protein [Candidatus Magasanikbacteria bacterium]